MGCGTSILAIQGRAKPEPVLSRDASSSDGLFCLKCWPDILPWFRFLLGVDIGAVIVNTDLLNDLRFNRYNAYHDGKWLIAVLGWWESGTQSIKEQIERELSRRIFYASGRNSTLQTCETTENHVGQAWIYAITARSKRKAYNGGALRIIRAPDKSSGWRVLASSYPSTSIQRTERLHLFPCWKWHESTKSGYLLTVYDRGFADLEYHRENAFVSLFIIASMALALVLPHHQIWRILFWSSMRIAFGYKHQAISTVQSDWWRWSQGGERPLRYGHVSHQIINRIARLEWICRSFAVIRRFLRRFPCIELCWWEMGDNG